MSLASRIENAWYTAAPWLWLLRPLELLFRGVTGLRRWLYRRGVLRSYRAPVPVVVVGNITVGGTGKTPVVIALVEALRDAGLRPGVVSRGYGARADHYPHLLGPASDASQAGDEPLLIYRRTGAPCAVDPDRGRAVAQLLAQNPLDIVIADDGLQHYALARDFEIAVLDANRRIGNGFCLPAGPLREPPSRLRGVDWLLYRGGEGERDGVRYRPAALVDVATGEQRPFAPASPGERVHAVAGIGQPAQFFATLRAAGFDPQEHVFPDHHSYTAADLAAFAGAPVIMTEKDAVKCRELAPAESGRWCYLRIDARVPPALVTAVRALVPRAA